MNNHTRQAEFNEWTDETLVERYRRGQTQAFRELMERYRQELFHFLMRFTGNRAAAEDAFQDAFLQVHTSIDSFDTDKRFKPWLFTIAANKARDQMRKAKRRPAVPLSAPVGDQGESGRTFVDLMEADLPQPEDEAEKAELAERVSRMVGQMPDHLREILLMAYFQRFSYAEIAEALGIPLGTVKSRLHTAVGYFADEWKKQNPSTGDA
jgi:RNA polymerase sigma-70 factor (ECF subfamily)